MAERGRPKKYVTTEMWNGFMNNHWKHMNWKVNGILAILVIETAFLIAIFSLGLISLFGK